jgi:hypothetical protein
MMVVASKVEGSREDNPTSLYGQSTPGYILKQQKRKSQQNFNEFEYFQAKPCENDHINYQEFFFGLVCGVRVYKNYKYSFHNSSHNQFY